MIINPFHLLTESGDWLLTEDGLSHILLEEATSLEHEIGGVPRGDDAGGIAQNTGKARKAIYERQIREIEERFASQPVPKTARKRKVRIERLETAIEELAQEPLPAVYRLENLLERIEDYDGTKTDYTAILEAWEAYTADLRRARHRRIAIAMLMVD